MRSIFLAMSLVALTSDASAAVHSSPSITVDEVLTGRHVGDRLRVRGYLLFGDDAKNLWNDKAALDYIRDNYVPPDEPAWNHCLTLVHTGKLRSYLAHLSGHEVIITGFVERLRSAANSINLGACSDMGLLVQEVRPN